MNSDEPLKPTSTLQTIGILLGGLCFIFPCLLVSSHLEFYDAATTVYRQKINTEPSFTTLQLWGLNAVLGMVGGALMDYKHPFISGFSGMIVTLGMTAAAFGYLFWRESIYTFEILVMTILGGIPGIFLNAILRDKYVYYK